MECTKFDLPNDNGPTSNFFCVLLSLSPSFTIEKRNKNRGDPQLLIMMDATLFLPLSLSFFTMIIGQLHVNIKLLLPVCYFLSNRSFSLSPSLFLVFFLPCIEIYDIVMGANIERQCSLVQCQKKRREKEKDAYIEKRSSLYLCPYLSLIARLTFVLVL